MSTELSRLRSGPDAGEQPGGVGLGRIDVVAPGLAKDVIDGARQVWLTVAGLDHEAFTDGRARATLPGWFRRACRRRPAGSDRIWDVDAWLPWADPGERPWRWWDADVVDEDRGWVSIVLSEQPCPVGVLEATFYALGATRVDADF
ncbi:hypothetical protein [Propionibacterium acidifaciens]|uniref:hypothetical protein n=1 Tax=Propionibacterium acidifaciens TaxID=556499 RepID=UPI0004183C24|nr:hypothetical protein [Propionibacterium acidifaciens]